jgi:flagellar hook-associated protein 3 FlgL
MKPDGVSTLTLNNMLRDTTRFGQAALLKAQVELSTGRHSDVGLTLGSFVSRNINWRSEATRLKGQLASNGLASAQASVTQEGLRTVKDIADAFVATLAGLRTAHNGQALAQEAAKTALEAIKQAVNVSFNGKFIFGGLNANVAPLKTFVEGSPEAAVNAAFLSAFGIVPSDQAVKFITPSDMQAYLQTTFKDQFTDPNWTLNWSNADSNSILSRIDSTQRLSLAGNANLDAIRQLVQSVASIAGSGVPNLNVLTFELLVDSAMSGTLQSVQKVSSEQARIGLDQSALKKSTETNSRKLNVLKGLIGDTEGVDSYDAATRVNKIMSQLESSYALTGRMSKLSLVNFI